MSSSIVPKSQRHETRKQDPGRVGKAHGSVWKSMEWFVPFIDNQAIMYHGHQSPDDHSDCGPEIFCCPKAAILFQQRFPESNAANADWLFKGGAFLASWMNSGGPSVYYFFFCDPQYPFTVRFSPVYAPELRDVLLKRIPLDRYLENADLIFPEEKN
ncbi:MAG: hypothetical protein SFV81_06305 [Pirellulaceae bacterium]|nr:hypothetical protein [Pirellulaceae bacterium]